MHIEEEIKIAFERYVKERVLIGIDLTLGTVKGRNDNGKRKKVR